MLQVIHFASEFLLIWNSNKVSVATCSHICVYIYIFQVFFLCLRLNVKANVQSGIHILIVSFLRIKNLACEGSFVVVLSFFKWHIINLDSDHHRHWHEDHHQSSLAALNSFSCKYCSIDKWSRQELCRRHIAANRHLKFAHRNAWYGVWVICYLKLKYISSLSHLAAAVHSQGCFSVVISQSCETTFSFLLLANTSH